MAALPPPPPPPSTQPGFIRLHPFSVQDDPSVGIGGEVARLLLPADWQVQSQMIWRHDMVHLASLMLVAWNPQTADQFTIFPTHGFTWTQGGVMFFPPGSNYLGSEVCEPLWDGAQFISRIILPRFRANVTGLRMLGHEEYPRVAQAAAIAAAEPGVNKTGKAGRVRVAFTIPAGPVEEDFFYCILYSIIPGMPHVFWGPKGVTSMCAPAGRLDRLIPLHQAIVSSVRLNPRWVLAHQQVQQMFINNQMNSIRAAGRLSQYISRISDEMLQSSMAQWEAQQASQDHVHRVWDEYIRGVDSYSDPTDPSRRVELPSGYEQAWTNGVGDYIVSESVLFDPNVELSGTWQKMERAR